MTASNPMYEVDPISKLKMYFGMMLLVSLVGLAAAFGIGHVEEKTSYGLMPIVTTLATLAGLFGGWAFREEKERKDAALLAQRLDRLEALIISQGLILKALPPPPEPPPEPEPEIPLQEAA